MVVHSTACTPPPFKVPEEIHTNRDYLPISRSSLSNLNKAGAFFNLKKTMPQLLQRSRVQACPTRDSDAISG
jgi:hypothetical protein